MPKTKRPRRKPRPAARAKAPRATKPATTDLRRRLARLVAEQKRHARQLESARRAADRRLAAMVQEIARLRHHEARVAALERMVVERDEVVAVQARRLAELETLLRAPGELG